MHQGAEPPIGSGRKPMDAAAAARSPASGVIMQDMPLTALSALDVAAAVRSRRLKARAVAEAFLERIARLQPRLNAFITVAHEHALRQADAVDTAIAEGRDPGPLAGVPFTVKDLVGTAGLRTTMGSRAFADQVPAMDAVPVARLKAAGAVLLGKTTTPELGHKALTDSPLFGCTLNPWNGAYTCGGSSGGAGVAAAARLGLLHIGTDGGGSVRIPAAACGIVGLKATLGRIPHVQAPDLFGNNAYIGPMALTVAEARAMYAVMAGPHPGDPYAKCLPADSADGKPLDGLRVGWIARVGDHPVEAEVLAATESALQALRGLGARIESATIDLVSLEPHYMTMLEAALAARVGAKVSEATDLFDPSFVRMVERGRRQTGVAVQEAAMARSDAYRRVEALLETFDLLVSPTLAAASVAASQITDEPVVIAGQSIERIRQGWYPYTFPFNLTGHPAISLPCGRASSKVPIGLQIIGPWYSEGLILDVSAALESALGLRLGDVEGC